MKPLYWNHLSLYFLAIAVCFIQVRLRGHASPLLLNLAHVAAVQEMDTTCFNGPSVILKAAQKLCIDGSFQKIQKLLNQCQES